MPYVLDEIDVAIIKALQEDGRKSFRQISRETHISTPTVTARFNRLVNLGLIKSVTVILDTDKIQNEVITPVLKQSKLRKTIAIAKKGVKLPLRCDYCHAPISSKPVILKFGKYERYLCCTSCRRSYKEKYGARIASLSESQ